MIKFKSGTICMPLSLDCNLHCKYCFRENNKIDKIPEFTEDMITFLKNLTPEQCLMTSATGGETLLHFDRVKEYFSYVPKNIPKKLLTNCTLLTQEIVDYLNENDIILQTSHDGPMTKFLRGIDTFEDEKIVNLIRQVKKIKVVCVITKYNVDVWENYFDTIKKLGRTDIDYNSFPVMDFPNNRDLIEGFDYDKWFETWVQFKSTSLNHDIRRKKIKRKYGFNYLPNGQICSCTQIDADYGSIYVDSLEDCKEKVKASGGFDYCIKNNCKYVNTCRFSQDGISDHVCKCRRMVMDKVNPEFLNEVKKYVTEHWDEIKGKYGYVEK